MFFYLSLLHLKPKACQVTPADSFVKRLTNMTICTHENIKQQLISDFVFRHKKIFSAKYANFEHFYN